ncbi:MAG UNVERIFIED_CONTAM: hypothetical protein LOD86_00630 [Thermobifida fusca]
MDARTRLAAIGNLLSRLVLLIDAYVAACLDRRPLIRVAEDVAAWLGRAWRASAAEARIRRYGPGRGLIAVVITQPTPTRKDAADD